MTKIDSLNTLQKFADILHLNSIVDLVLRWLGFSIIKLLYTITSMVESGIDMVFSLSDFFKTPEVESFISSFAPLFIPLLISSIIYIAFAFFFQNKNVRSKLIENIAISVVVIVGLPAIMTTLLELSNIGVSAIFPDDISISQSLIKDNITDLLLYDDNNFSQENLKNNLSPENILRIDPIQVIPPDQAKNKNIFDSKIVFDKDGKPTVQSLSNSWYLGVFKEAYYRYHIDFLQIFIGLISLTLVFLFTIFKICKICFELAVHKLLATLLAFFDIGKGVRVKKVLQDIIISILTLFFTIILIRFYLIGVAYGGGIDNVLIKLIWLITISIATICGSDLVEKILGIDIGAGNVAKGFATGYYGIQTASSIAKGGGKAIGGALSLGGKAVGGMGKISSYSAGFSKGIYDNMTGKASSSSVDKDRGKESSSPVKNPPGDNKIHKNNGNINPVNSSADREKTPSSKDEISSQTGQKDKNRDKNKLPDNPKMEGIHDKIKNSTPYKNTSTRYNKGKKLAHNLSMPRRKSDGIHHDKINKKEDKTL